MKKSKRRLVIVYAGLFIFYAFLLLPIVWLVLSSFRNTDSIQSGRLLPYPSELTVTNYVEAFRIANLTTFLVNSFIIAITVMLLVVFIASLGAYALSRFRLRGRNIFMMLALTPQFFPYVLIDSHLGLILTLRSLFPSRSGCSPVILLPFRAIWIRLP